MTKGTALSSNVYHIENYLLEPTFIYRAMADLLREKWKIPSIQAVDAELRQVARDAVDEVSRTRFLTWLNSKVGGCFNFGGSPNANFLPTVEKSLEASVQRLNSLKSTDLMPAALRLKFDSIREEIERGMHSRRKVKTTNDN